MKNLVPGIKGSVKETGARGHGTQKSDLNVEWSEWTRSARQALPEPARPPAREARCHSRHRRTSWAWLPLWRPGGRRVAHFSERSCGLQSTVGPARVPPEPSQRLTNWNSIKSLPLSVLWFSPNAVHKGKGTFYLGSCELFFFF